MNIDPIQYAYISIVADGILSIIMIFQWLVARKEKHALFWGIAQLAFMTSTLIWYFSAMSQDMRVAFCALLNVIFLAGHWGGTRFFFGGLRPGEGKRALWIFATLAIILQIWWHYVPSVLPRASTFILGMLLIWIGFKLARGRDHQRYRVLGLALILRGLFNLSCPLLLIPEHYQETFLMATSAKFLTILGMIYAVQHEIAQRYIHTIDSLSNGFLILDKGGYVDVANQRSVRLLGYDSTLDLIEKSITTLMPDLTLQRANDFFFNGKDGASHVPTLEITLPLRNGNTLPLEIQCSPYIERGRLFCLVQLIDITERKKKDAQLYQAAHVDPVTGFANRHALVQQLALVIAHANQSGHGCALLFIDLDKFKRINDTFGHLAGDELLRKVAQQMQKFLRCNDMLARFGGDEFIVLLPDLARDECIDQASDCALRILTALRQPLDVLQHVIGMSASIGVACHPMHGTDAETLLRNADISMYAGKKTGGNTVSLFDETMNAASEDALAIDGALRQAITGNELELHYQAITDCRSGELKKAEALLRWNSAVLGPISPDRFIPVSEDSGMIIELGNWVLNQVCHQASQWKSSILSEIIIGINVSSRQLIAPGFVSQLRTTLARFDLPPRLLELELTERVLIDDNPKVHAVLEQLLVLGVSISLDDFGTGYSSLSYLPRFPIQTLKIDRSFVMNIEQSERSRKLTHTIILMGHSLGLELIAEGVETAEQADILRQMGCHYLQGYLIARPSTADELLRFAGTLRR